MKHDKFDVVLEYGQEDFSGKIHKFDYIKFINNENYGYDKILHNVSAEEARNFCKNNATELACKKEIENSHLKHFRAMCFWTSVQED